MISSRRKLPIVSPRFLALVPGADDQERLPSKVYLFQDLPTHHSKALQFRPILSGTTVDGCKISVHESSVAAQSEQHPPHHHNGETSNATPRGCEADQNGMDLFRFPGQRPAQTSLPLLPAVLVLSMPAGLPGNELCSHVGVGRQ